MASDTPSSAPAPTAGRAGFLETVRAEELPSQLRWGLPETLAALSIPAVLLSGWLFSLVTDDLAVRAVGDTLTRAAIFTAVVIVNRQLLARHWRAFRAAFWRSTALVLVGMVVIQVVISVISALLRPVAGDASSATAGGEHVALGILLVASLAPTVTALIEDFAFRHTLLMVMPVWGRWWTAAALVLANALLFGAVHFHNFDGHLLLTLSYAGAGLLMNLVYLWTRNIWHVLLMHGLNNFLLGGQHVVLFVRALESFTG